MTSSDEETRSTTPSVGGDADDRPDQQPSTSATCPKRVRVSKPPTPKAKTSRSHSVDADVKILETVTEVSTCINKTKCVQDSDKKTK